MCGMCYDGRSELDARGVMESKQRWSCPHGAIAMEEGDGGVRVGQQKSPERDVQRPYCIHSKKGKKLSGLQSRKQGGVLIQ